jgi:hypothetical protein
MQTGTRRRTLLMLLGALLLGTAWRYLPPISGPGGDPEEPAAMRPSGAAVKAPHPGTEVASLHLASLDAARPLSAAGRDPWRFQDPPPHKSPPREDEPILAQPPRQSAIPPQPAATIPELTLEYLGSFGPRDKRIAVLSEGGRAFNALEGEVIEGRFVVERIGYESVEIRLLRVPGGSTKRLGLRRPDPTAPP